LSNLLCSVGTRNSVRNDSATRSKPVKAGRPEDRRVRHGRARSLARRSSSILRIGIAPTTWERWRSMSRDQTGRRFAPWHAVWRRLRAAEVDRGCPDAPARAQRPLHAILFGAAGYRY
jgi:hypothetical protein